MNAARAGQLNKEQQLKLRQDIMAVRAQEMADIRQNGKRQLSNDQLSHLNTSLDTISQQQMAWTPAAK